MGLKAGRCIGIWLILSVVFAGVIFPSSAQQEQITHVVQRGETLYRIALRYGLDMNTLIQANNIADPRRILAGQSLVIPGVSAPDSSAEISNPLVATAPIVHTVARGEILSRIAQRYGVTVADILAANNIGNANRIYPGQQLQIWSNAVSVEPVAQPAVEQVAAPEPEVVPAASQPATSDGYTIVRTHVVQQGEYLSGIARNYGLNWTTLAEVNSITGPNRLYAGMTLNIPDRNISVSDLGIIARSAAAASPRIGVGREIVVVLSTQMVYAFEDGILKYSALSSTGLPATPTVQGDFKIWHKTPSQTMSGPGYSLPNVQWVMYFYQGYGLHGTYWHNNFGRPMSHGCVNLTNDDARWFYDFASIGTPVHVRWS